MDDLLTPAVNDQEVILSKYVAGTSTVSLVLPHLLTSAGVVKPFKLTSKFLVATRLSIRLAVFGTVYLDSGFAPENYFVSTSQEASLSDLP